MPGILMCLIRSLPGMCLMADIEPTTEEQKASAAGTERASNPESFIPARRVDTFDGTELATETRWLLQQRLRAASLVLVVGFGLFLARSFVLYQFESLAVFFYALLLALLIVCTGRFRAAGSPRCAASRP